MFRLERKIESILSRFFIGGAYQAPKPYTVGFAAHSGASGLIWLKGQNVTVSSGYVRYLDMMHEANNIGAQSNNMPTK